MSQRPILSDDDLELLSAYLDDELSATERSMIEQRLQIEKYLAQELEQLRQTQALLRALPLLKAPRDFSLNSADFTPSKKADLPKVVSFYRRPVLMAGLAAAAALILVFGIFLSSFQSDDLADDAVLQSFNESPSSQENTQQIEDTNFLPSSSPPSTIVAAAPPQEAATPTSLGADTGDNSVEAQTGEGAAIPETGDGVPEGEVLVPNNITQEALEEEPRINPMGNPTATLYAQAATSAAEENDSNDSNFAPTATIHTGVMSATGASMVPPSPRDRTMFSASPAMQSTPRRDTESSTTITEPNVGGAAASNDTDTGVSALDQDTTFGDETSRDPNEVPAIEDAEVAIAESTGTEMTEESAVDAVPSSGRDASNLMAQFVQTIRTWLHMVVIRFGI